MHEQRQVGEHFLHRGLARVHQQALEIHLNPRRNAADEPKVLLASLFHHRIHFGLPIFNAVGLPRRKSVGLQVSRHMVRHDATQPSQMNAACGLGQLRTALQEDHLAVHKRRIPCPGDVSEQRVAGAPNVVGHAVLGQGDVLGPGGRPACLAEVQGHPRPNHILLPLHGPLHVSSKAFIVAHRHLGLEFRHRESVFQVMVPAKRRGFAPGQQGTQRVLLRRHRIGHRVAQTTHGPAGQRQTQCGLPSHAAKIAWKATRHRPEGQCLVQVVLCRWTPYLTVSFLVVRKPSALSV